METLDSVRHKHVLPDLPYPHAALEPHGDATPAQCADPSGAIRARRTRATKIGPPTTAVMIPT